MNYEITEQESNQVIVNGTIEMALKTVFAEVMNMNTKSLIDYSRKGFIGLIEAKSKLQPNRAERKKYKRTEIKKANQIVDVLQKRREKEIENLCNHAYSFENKDINSEQLEEFIDKIFEAINQLNYKAI